MEWLGDAGFEASYAFTIGEADIGTDSGRTSWAPVIGQQERHLNYPSRHSGEDSRLFWYRTEFVNAEKYLKIGNCVEAAKAFGRGLHSLQDRSAHRDWPEGGDWSPFIAHPGWWDAWDNEDLERMYSGIFDEYPSEEFWRRYHQAHGGVDYNTYVERPHWWGSDQGQSQYRAKERVIKESKMEIQNFLRIVKSSCPCGKEMLR